MNVTRTHPETQEQNTLKINLTKNDLNIIEFGGDLDGLNISNAELRFVNTGLLPGEFDDGGYVDYDKYHD
jgi:hypothetical protein